MDVLAVPEVVDPLAPQLTPDPAAPHPAERARWHFFNCCAQATAIWRPVAWLPVNATTSTWRFATRAAPASGPKPVTTLTTPAGSSSKHFMRRRVESGVSSDGLATTVFPAARAGASFHASRSSG